MDPAAHAALRVAAVGLAGGALGSPAPTATALALDRARLEQSVDVDEDDEEGADDGGHWEEVVYAVRAAGERAGESGREVDAIAANASGDGLLDGEQVVYYSSSAVACSVGLELGFDFSPTPSLAQMKVSSSSFISLWMLSLTATWPQQVASRRRKYLARFGVHVTGGSVDANDTDASLKTWASRIMVACAFSKFVGRTVWV